MSSQTFYDFDVTTQARSMATRQYLAELIRPWMDDPAVIPLLAPGRQGVIEDAVAAKIDSGILQPTPAELAPYAEWRVDKLLADFLTGRRGMWAQSTMARVERRAYWNYEWAPYVNDAKLVSSITPPVKRNIVEWVGVGFAGKPGVGKTTKMCFLAALIERVYQAREETVSIHYTNRLVDAVESLDRSTVQVIIVDDASLFQHSRQSMTQENIDVIKTLDVIRHRFEDKVSKTGVIITFFGVQRYKGLDLGIRALTRCFVWAGLLSEEDEGELAGPSRSFLTQQEAAFERHDLSARLYGLVTGLAGDDFLMRAELDIATDTFARVSSAFHERQVEAWKQAGKQAEGDAYEFLKRALPTCRVYPGGGFTKPDLTVVYPDDTKDFVNAKHYDFTGKTGIGIGPSMCKLEVEAAKEAHRPSIYIFVVDKQSKRKALVELRLDRKGVYVKRGDLLETSLVPLSMLAAAKLRAQAPTPAPPAVPPPAPKNYTALYVQLESVIEDIRRGVEAADSKRTLSCMLLVAPILEEVEGDNSPGAERIRKRWRDFGEEKVRRPSDWAKGS